MSRPKLKREPARFAPYNREELIVLIEQLEDKLSSAEAVVRQVAADTYGKEMTVKEFAERSCYDH